MSSSSGENSDGNHDSQPSSLIIARSSPPQPSSPEQLPSSPVRCYVESSDASEDEYERPRKRFRESGVSRDRMFWPQSVNDSDSASSSSTEFSGVHDNEPRHPSYVIEESDHHSSEIASVSSSAEETESDSSEAEDSDSEHSEGGAESESSSAQSDSSDESLIAESINGDRDLLVSEVWEGAELTVDQGVLSLMEIYVNHNIDKATLGSVLKCLLKFLPPHHQMPQTPYQLLKYVYDLCPLPKEVIHFYCSKCQLYLGIEAKNCESCGGNISHRYFQLSIEHQLKNLFENQNLSYYLDKYAKKRDDQSQNGMLRDICDGSEYERMHIPGRYNLSLIGHTDGVSITESSNVAMWPLEYVICELPPNMRFKFILVNGMWLDDSKPNFNTFYRPFADEGEKLYKEGFTWLHPESKIRHKSFVSIIGFVADGPVRAQIQNILSIGGRHSCNTCEQKMLKLPAEPVLLGVKSKRRKRVFAFSENPSTLRSKERMKAQAQITVRRKVAANGGMFVAKKGVLGPSIVSKLPKFDRSTGVFAEYMHLVLGIVKQFMEMWFDTSQRNLPCSLIKHMDDINAFLLSVRVPDYVTRIPKSTDSYSKWKANELRAFVLYYSLIILSPFMEDAYFKHWMLFVCSLEILLRDNITETDIVKAETMLRLFIRNFAHLYKIEALTYNLHNILHLPLTVRRWGNLQYISGFQFENFNGSLSKRIHGSKNQGKEIMNNVRILCGIGALKARVESNDFNSSKMQFQLCSKIDRYRVSNEEQQLLDGSGKSPAYFYYRAIINNETYTTSIYTRQLKRNNYTVCFTNNLGMKTYGEVKCFVEFEFGDMMAIINTFIIDHVRYFMNEETAVVVNHIVPISETERFELVCMKRILSKVIRVGKFVCLRPNTYEVNL